MKYLIYRIKKLYHFFRTFLFEALPANLVYNFPSRKLVVIMITGTDGKTTSSTLLYHVLKTAGKKVALISTVAAYIGEKELDTGFHVTNPNPWLLQKMLAEVVRQEFQYVVLETTSHGIYQYRNWGIKPTIAAVTNITNNEHLDYHVSYPEYVATKASLLTQAKLAIIPEKDESTEILKKILDTNQTQYLLYSEKKLPEKVSATVHKRFPQNYNVKNSALITSIAQQLGIDESIIATAITTFPGVPGRMQEVKNTAGLRIVIDFAHTPNALKEALTALRATMQKNQKLIAIFGCAGLRDPSKRPQMGKYGATLADYCIFTAEDPRTENVWTIIRQMKEQLPDKHDHIHSIPDRQAAIDFAIHTLAKPGDTIGIFGKGHEQSMCYGRIEYPWNDAEGVIQSLRT